MIIKENSFICKLTGFTFGYMPKKSISFIFLAIIAIIFIPLTISYFLFMVIAETINKKEFKYMSLIGILGGILSTLGIFLSGFIIRKLLFICLNISLLNKILLTYLIGFSFIALCLIIYKFLKKSNTYVEYKK